jgi:UDP-2,3-diacylglucosamine pyrophosphatase LpxH
MVKFQYISDIHLEFLKKIPKIKVLANNLCLLGDIGFPNTKIYTQFILECSKNYKNVFLLYGNHEYYSGLVKKPIHKNCFTINQLNELTKSLPSNIHFLNNTTLFIDNDDIVFTNKCVGERKLLKIIGSTLWSNIDLKIAYDMNDYYNSYTEFGKLTPNDTIEFFNTAKNYIINELSKDTNFTLILTHHGTHNICNGTHYKNSKLKSAFTTDIPELLEYKHLKCCINGHTHTSINETINNIQFLANCYGYPNENKLIVKYNENSVIEIELN